MEKNENAQTACLMCKLIKISKSTDDLSNGFHRSLENGEQEMTNNKGTEGSDQKRVWFKNIFGLLEHQENATMDNDII